MAASLHAPVSYSHPGLVAAPSQGAAFALDAADGVIAPGRGIILLDRIWPWSGLLDRGFENPWPAADGRYFGAQVSRLRAVGGGTV